VDEELKKQLKDQLNDFVVAVVIVLKEAVFAFIVLVVGHILAWAIQHVSDSSDQMANYLRWTSDFGSGILFVVLVIKDLWEYLRKK